MEEKKQDSVFSVSYLPALEDYVEQRLLRLQLSGLGSLCLAVRVFGLVLLAAGILILLFYAMNSVAALIFADILIVAGFFCIFFKDLFLPFLERRRAKKCYEVSNTLKDSVNITLYSDAFCVKSVIREGSYPLNKLLQAIEGDNSFILTIDENSIWQIPKRLLEEEQINLTRDLLKKTCPEQFITINLLDSKEKKKR